MSAWEFVANQTEGLTNDRNYGERRPEKEIGLIVMKRAQNVVGG